MLTLGIESSCDETALAILDDCLAVGERVLAHTLYSQVDMHAATGGVVPEVAARAHVERIAALSHQCFAKAKVSPKDIDIVAGIAGPGLIGGVSVGLMFAKGFALANNVPLVPVNHLAGHALTARMTDDTPYPYLLLLVSGGHCQILVVEGPTTFQRWATTIDDAVGEAFDKAAKMMGLGFPGGPALERAAATGNPNRFDLPRPMIKKPTMDFSFSGLKTATKRALDACQNQQDIHDLAASFQAAAAESLTAQTRKAAKRFIAQFGPGHTLVVAGGVARNAWVRHQIGALAKGLGLGCVTPPLEYCTDNAAMIAWAGGEQYRQSPQMYEHSKTLAACPRPRWPLDPNAEPSSFAGLAKA